MTFKCHFHPKLFYDSMILWMPLVAEQVWRLRKTEILCGQSQKSGLFAPSEMSWVVFPHYVEKKINWEFFLKKLSVQDILPLSCHQLLTGAQWCLTEWCLFWMKCLLAISLNEIPIRCLISIVQSYSRYLLESWQFLLFRVRVSLHSMGMSDCSLLGFNCIKIKCKPCFFQCRKAFLLWPHEIFHRMWIYCST